MGTNYYVKKKESCECCGRPYETLHIGKSSLGNKFALHKTDCLRSLESWARFLPGKRIVDEYGNEIAIGAMLERIVSDQWEMVEGEFS